KAGLEANEFCMWVTSESLRAHEAEAALGIAIPELDRFLSNGQIEILDHSQWYMLGGNFDADRVLQGWFSKLDAARKRGFEGLRVTGNVFWEEGDWEDYTHYEAKVNDIIGSTRMLALCTCSLEKYRPREVIDVVSSHEFALLREGGRWELLKNIARRKAERTLKETLRESEERYRQLVEQMNDGIFVVGSDQRYVDVNPAGCAMLGMTREEVLASSFRDILDPSEHRRLPAKIASLANGNVQRDEWRIRRKDGSVFF